MRPQNHLDHGRATRGASHHAKRPVLRSSSCGASVPAKLSAKRMTRPLFNAYQKARWIPGLFVRPHAFPPSSDATACAHRHRSTLLYLCWERTSLTLGTRIICANCTMNAHPQCSLRYCPTNLHSPESRGDCRRERTTATRGAICATNAHRFHARRARRLPELIASTAP